MTAPAGLGRTARIQDGSCLEHWVHSTAPWPPSRSDTALRPVATGHHGRSHRSPRGSQPVAVRHRPQREPRSPRHHRVQPPAAGSLTTRSGSVRPEPSPEESLLRLTGDSRNSSPSCGQDRRPPDGPTRAERHPRAPSARASVHSHRDSTHPRHSPCLQATHLASATGWTHHSGPTESMQRRRRFLPPRPPHQPCPPGWSCGLPRALDTTPHFRRLRLTFGRGCLT